MELRQAEVHVRGALVADGRVYLAAKAVHVEGDRDGLVRDGEVEMLEEQKAASRGHGETRSVHRSINHSPRTIAAPCSWKLFARGGPETICSKRFAR